MPGPPIATILVPVDGSDCDERAVLAAAHVATHTAQSESHPPVSIVLVHVADAASHHERRQTLTANALALGVALEVEVLEGDPARQIVERAGQQPDTVICMADRGRTAIGDLILGSVTESVLTNCQQPVLVVGPKARPDPAGPVVVCIDDTPECQSILGPAAALARALGTSITLVEVVPPEERVEIDDVAPMDAPTAQGLRRLRDLATTLTEDEAPSIDVRVLYGADVAETIARYGDGADASAIALATRARGGVRRVMQGSTTHRLIARASAAVLAVRCKD
jgi:nucleotide-binding universal stress UspA family protein